MAVDEVDFQGMTPEQYEEFVKQQQEAGLIQSQGEGHGPVPDVALGQELHREIHDYGPKHVPHQTRVMWGVLANQHPSLANLDYMEASKIKSFIRQYERLLFTALPKGILTPKVKRRMFQGRILAYLNVSKGKGGFEAQMTRSTMIGVANTHTNANFIPRSTNRQPSARSRWGRFKGAFF